MANAFENQGLDSSSRGAETSGQSATETTSRLFLGAVAESAGAPGSARQIGLDVHKETAAAQPSPATPYILEPKLHQPRPGDTIPSLARQQLGSLASPAAVDQYIAQICQVNHLKLNAKLNGKEQIMLPGRTADGGVALLRPSGDREITYSDRVEIGGSDGSNILRTNTATASVFFEHHTGARIEDNFNAIVGDEKPHQFTRYGDSKPLVYLDDKKVAKEREHLDKLAASSISGQHQLETFRFNMAQLEDRAPDWGISRNDIINTYKQVEELLVHRSGKAILDDTTRAHLAQQIMSYAARPCVDQGHHNTCAEASLQARIFAMHPPDAARLIKDVALQGKYVAADGLQVDLYPAAHDESKAYPTPDNHRDFASEIFQVTAANLAFARANESNKKSSHGKPYTITVYEQREPLTNQTPADTGERRIDRTIISKDATVSRESPLHEPGLTDDDLVRVSWSITGKREDMVEIAHVDPFWDKDGTTKLVDKFGDERGLAAYLQGLKQQHKKFMVAMRVDAMDEPLWHEYGCTAEGKAIAPHSITVQGDGDKLVLVDNHWGQKNRHDASSPLTVHQLYELSLRANSKELVDDLTGDKAAAASGIGPGKEMDLLRHEQDAGLLKPGQLTAGIEQIIDNNFVLPAGNKPFDQATQAVYGCIVPNLSNLDRLEIKSYENKIGTLKNEDFDKFLTDEHVALNERTHWFLTSVLWGNDDSQEEKKLDQILESLPEERRQAIEAVLAQREANLPSTTLRAPSPFQFHLQLEPLPPPYVPPSLLFPPIKH